MKYALASIFGTVVLLRVAFVSFAADPSVHFFPTCDDETIITGSLTFAVLVAFFALVLVARNLLPDITAEQQAAWLRYRAKKRKDHS